MLKVTWQGGVWHSPDGERPVESAELPLDTKVRLIGETLVFHAPAFGGRVAAEASTLLVLPESRLISVVQTEEATNA